ncbi:MAG: gamma-glutamylcyclotransferase [Rhodobacteraceae bacterium]|nr:gamma-glutamylcyclotransferase [Paracoccaceae bacterium]
MALWVFGYGSLLWNPGFDVAEQHVATLAGYRRSFCMRSIHHRGTLDQPGLVLALDPSPGASCSGLSLRAASGTEDATLAMLRERELISSAYVERVLTLDLAPGEQVEAVVYVVDTTCAQYCGGLNLEEQAQVIASAVGGRGPNPEYLYNTATRLTEIGLSDPDLDWLTHRVRVLAG